MNQFADDFFELVSESSSIIDPNPTNGGFDGDNFRRHIRRGDLGDNIFAEVTILVRPSVSDSNSRYFVEVFACAGTVDRSLGAISDSSWSAVARAETFAAERMALKIGLIEAVRKAWDGLPELVRRLPEEQERRENLLRDILNNWHRNHREE